MVTSLTKLSTIAAKIYKIKPKNRNNQTRRFENIIEIVVKRKQKQIKEESPSALSDLGAIDRGVWELRKGGKIF